MKESDTVLGAETIRQVARAARFFSLGMRSRVALAIGLAITSSSMAQACLPTQEATPAETSATDSEQQELAERVAQLRFQLDSDSLVERVDAEQALLSIGPAALPHLEPATNSLPRESFDRLSKVRQRLEQMAAEQQTRASRCTLKGMFTLEQALAEIQKQTGNAFQETPLGATPVAIDLSDVSYWEAIAELERLFTDAQVDPYRAGDRLRWAERTKETPAAVVNQSGPFRFEVLRVESVKDLVNPSLSGITVTVRVRWEPRMRPISVTQDLKSLAATAGEQNLGASANADSFETLINGNPGSVDLQFVLETPTVRVDTLRDLIGSLSFTIPTPSMPFRFSGLEGSERQEARTGSTTVAMVRAAPRQQTYGVEVRIRFDEAAGSLESHRGWIFDCPVNLIDSTGKKVAYFTYETTLRTENEVGILYMFPLPESTEDLSLVFEAPSAILRVPVNFSFPSLELP